MRSCTDEHDARPGHRTEARTQGRRHHLRRARRAARHGRVEHQARLREGRHAVVARRRSAARAEDGLRRTRPQNRRCATTAPRAHARARDRRRRRPQADAAGHLLHQPVDLRADGHELRDQRCRLRALPVATRQARLHRVAAAEPLPPEGGEGFQVAPERAGDGVLSRARRRRLLQRWLRRRGRDADAGAWPDQQRASSQLRRAAAARRARFRAATFGRSKARA